MKQNLTILKASRTFARKVASTMLIALAASQAHGALTVVTQITNGAVPSGLQPLAGDLLETSVATFTGENAVALVRNGSFTDLPGNGSATFPASVWGNFSTPVGNIMSRTRKIRPVAKL